MGFLRRLYPGVFKLEKKVVKPFVIKLVVFVIISVLSGIVLSLPCAIFGVLSMIFTSAADLLTILTAIFGILGAAIAFILNVYITGGIVCSILKFVGVIKDTAGVEAANDDNAANNVAGKVGGVFGKVVDATTGVVNNVVDKVAGKKEDEAEETTEEKSEEVSEEATEEDKKAE